MNSNLFLETYIIYKGLDPIFVSATSRFDLHANLRLILHIFQCFRYQYNYIYVQLTLKP